MSRNKRVAAHRLKCCKDLVYRIESDQFSSTSLTFGRKLVGQRAVDQPMIEGQSEIAIERMAIASSITTGVFSTVPDAENRHLRLIDHRRREHAAEAAEVGDRERAARRPRPASADANARALPDPRSSAAARRHSSHRHCESPGRSGRPLQRHGDAEIDLVVIDDVRAFDRGVDDAGTARNASRGRARDERQERQRESVLRLEVLLVPFAQSSRPSSCPPCERW